MEEVVHWLLLLDSSIDSKIIHARVLDLSLPDVHILTASEDTAASLRDCLMGDYRVSIRSDAYGEISYATGFRKSSIKYYSESSQRTWTLEPGELNLNESIEIRRWNLLVYDRCIGFDLAQLHGSFDSVLVFGDRAGFGAHEELTGLSGSPPMYLNQRKCRALRVNASQVGAVCTSPWIEHVQIFWKWLTEPFSNTLRYSDKDLLERLKNRNKAACKFARLAGPIPDIKGDMVTESQVFALHFLRIFDEMAKAYLEWLRYSKTLANFATFESYITANSGKQGFDELDIGFFPGLYILDLLILTVHKDKKKLDEELLTLLTQNVPLHEKVF